MKKILILVVLFSMSTTVFAKNTANIFSGSTSSSFLFTQSNYDGYKTSFWAGAGYDHAFSNGFQVGTSATVSIQSSLNVFSLTVGPAYNFNSEDLENSFFASIHVGGISSTSWGFTTTEGLLSLELAKRFKLGEGISFSPGISATKVLGPNSNDPAISINLFKFSLLF